MSGFRVNIQVGVGWIILRGVKKSNWAGRKRRIVVMIVALVSIMEKMIVDLALRSATGGLMWWWEGTSTTTTTLPASATSTNTDLRWSQMVA